MSQQDEYFDYYFKLKDNLDKTVIKKNERFKNHSFNPQAPYRKKRPKSWRDIHYPSNYEYTDDGKVIVRFN